jgi:hypothetical protein
MTQAQAKILAKTLNDGGSDYVARKVNGHWLVWCNPSDHAVEFDNVESWLANIAKRKEV